MKKFILSLVAVLSLGIAASAANYTVDESSIDALIENAVEVTPAFMEAEAGDFMSQIVSPSIHIGSAPKPIVAFILSVLPPTGWLAIHRMYLGTSPLAVILNIVTGAGCGVVYVLDWVSLLLGTLDNNIGAYVNNGRWWMWADII